MLLVDAGNPGNLSARFRVFNYAIILKFKPFTFLQFPTLRKVPRINLHFCPCIKVKLMKSFPYKF